MGNHHIDCDYCHLDTRGLSGVKGCHSKAEASTCWEYKNWLKEDASQQMVLRMEAAEARAATAEAKLAEAQAGWERWKGLQAGTADVVRQVEKRAAAAEEEVVRLAAENDFLRASLANGSGPCPYCELPKEDWAKCASGFPGCGRADDATMCPNVGASLEAEATASSLRDRVAVLEKALKPFAEEAATLEEGERGHLWESPQAMNLTADHLRAARTALQGASDAKP